MRIITESVPALYAVLKAVEPAEEGGAEDGEEDQPDVAVQKLKTFVVGMEGMHLVDFLKNESLVIKCFNCVR